MTTQLLPLGAALLGLTSACISLPASRNADTLIAPGDAPGLCGGAKPFALTPDGRAVAWFGDQSIVVHDWTAHLDATYPTPPSLFYNPPVFSSDGRWIAVNADADPWTLLTIDRTDATVSSVALPDTCMFVTPVWDAGTQTFALGCSDLVIYGYDPQNPNTPPTRVLPPEALSGCAYPQGVTQPVGFASSLQRASALCSDGTNLKFVTWAWAGGVSHVTAELALDGNNFEPSPVLTFPNVNHPGPAVIDPQSGELLLAGRGLYTVDPAENYRITRMLSRDFAQSYVYDPRGGGVVAAMMHGYSYRILAWQLGDGADPYFATHDKFQVNFSLSNNGVLGACDLDQTFHIWHLQP